jgi:hypothetical protein
VSLESDGRRILAESEQDEPRAVKWPCPDCEGATKVYDTRGPQRWRECKACKVRFLTEERYIRRIRKYRNRKSQYIELRESA